MRIAFLTEMGFVGKGEGCVAMAVALIQKTSKK